MIRSITEFDTIAFDWDGTVVDSVPYKIAQNMRLAQEFGNELSEEQVRSIWNAASGFPELMSQLCLTEDMGQIMEVVKRDYNKPEFAKRPFSFGRAALERVNATGINVALITNLTREVLNLDASTVGITPLEKYFAFTQTADEHAFKKPDPRVFSTMLKYLDVTPEKCLYIGDELKDYFAAKDAGLAFIGVQSGMTTVEEFSDVGAQSVSNIDEIITLLNSVS